MAVAKRYRVTLTAEERDDLRRMISRGKADARKLARQALVPLRGAEGGHGELFGVKDHRGIVEGSG